MKTCTEPPRVCLKDYPRALCSYPQYAWAIGGLDSVSCSGRK